MSDPKLTLQDLSDIRWRWLRPETALREHDHKQLASVFDALLASQTALEQMADRMHELDFLNYEQQLRAALLDKGDGDAST